MNRIINFFIIFIFISYAGSENKLFADQSIIEEAKELENKKGKAEAIKLYKNWLLKNKNDLEFNIVLNQLIILEPRTDEVVVFLINILPDIENSKNITILLKLLIQIETLSGKIDRAREYSERLYSFSDSNIKYEYLLTYSYLLYEQGFIGESKKQCEIVLKNITDKELWVRAAKLYGLLLYMEGNVEKSLKYYKIVLNKIEGTKEYPSILLSYFELLYYSNNNVLAEIQFNLLKNKYPNSLEYYLALKIMKNNTKSKIENLPSPSQLLISSNNLLEKKGNIHNNDFNDANENKIVYIQTGSFLVKENADYMVAELKKNKFKAIIIVKELKNKNYFRVLVEIPESTKNINDFVIKLKEVGFEGIRYFPD